MGGDKREGGGEGGGDKKRQKRQYLPGRGKGQFNRAGGPKTAGFDRLRVAGVKVRPRQRQRGCLVSCDVRAEPMCQSECCMAFAEKAERRYPELFAGADGAAGGGADDDVEAALAREAAAAADDAAHFTCVQTNIKGLVFVEFRAAAMDPLRVCKDLVEEVRDLGRSKTKYATRATPVLATSYANADAILKAAKPVVEAHLGAAAAPTKYSVIFKRRSNSEVDRMEIIKGVADLADKKHSVDLTAPDKCVLIDILTNVCLIGVAEDYFALKKYNLMELAGATAKKSTEMLAGGRVKPAAQAEDGDKGGADATDKGSKGAEEKAAKGADDNKAAGTKEAAPGK